MDLRVLTRLGCVTIVAVAALAGLVACGSQEASDDRGASVNPIVPDARKPAAYVLADPACQSAKDPVTLTRTSVRAWNGDQIETRAVALDGISTGTSLRSPAVDETTYNDIYERDCDVSKGQGHYCDGPEGGEVGWTATADPKPLRICRDNVDYGRTTYEGVALASIHYVQTAQNRYQELAPGDTALAPIRLSILPEFIDYYDNFPQGDGRKVRLKTWITHNSAHFQTPPMIAVFPETEETTRTARGFFWESQFVLGHEYGHHIDFTRNGMLLATMGLTWNPLRHNVFDETAFATSGSGESDRASVHGAVGESFADLTAYYGEGGTGASLSSLPCFGFNRDVANKAFRNGDEKELTEDRLSLLLTGQEETMRDCTQPQYRDIHIAGAIISYTLNQAFARLAAASPQIVPDSPDDVDQRYRMTISWMDRYVKASRGIGLDEQGSAWLTPISTALAGVADEFLGNLSLQNAGERARAQADLCKIVQKGLPTIKDAPFALAGGSCG